LLLKNKSTPIIFTVVGVLFAFILLEPNNKASEKKQEVVMQRFFRTVLAVVVVALSLASAAWGEVNVNVNVGIPGLRIELSGPPDFIMPPSLGFYVAVGTPYDLYRVNNNYYVFQNNAWYRGTYYNGPWQVVNYQQLPQSLRRHNHEQIRAIRDEEYRHYRENQNNYRGKYFKPDKSWKEQQKEEKKQAKREQKQMKEERRDDRKHTKDDDRRGDQKEKKQGGHGHEK
jgi:hypothetical protein